MTPKIFKQNFVLQKDLDEKILFYQNFFSQKKIVLSNNFFLKIQRYSWSIEHLGKNRTFPTEDIYIFLFIRVRVSVKHINKTLKREDMRK